jgi:hypothetical protein
VGTVTVGDEMLTAEISHTVHPGTKHYYHYDITFQGEKVVENSIDAECELARVLQARGLKGTVQIIDAETKRHRMSILIEKAALLTVRDSDKRIKFSKWKPWNGPENRG